MAGKVELIGVYQLPVTAELIAEQAEVLYGDEASSDEIAQARRQLESTVLVEVLVSNADADFDLDAFMQEDPRLPPESWQVAWAEAFLSADGQRLLVERGEPLPEGQATFRVAFYIHWWRAELELSSSYGSLPGAPPVPMPARLRQLAPYEPIDWRGRPIPKSDTHVRLILSMTRESKRLLWHGTCFVGHHYASPVPDRNRRALRDSKPPAERWVHGDGAGCACRWHRREYRYI